MPGPGLEGRGRGDVEDPPDLRSIIAGSDGMRHSSVSAPQLRSIISRWRGPSSSAKRPGQPEAGIVDQARRPCSPCAARSAISRAAAPGFAEVDRDRARIAELGGQRLEPVLAPRDQHQPLAARAELAGEIDPSPADAPVIRVTGVT